MGQVGWGGGGGNGKRRGGKVVGKSEIDPNGKIIANICKVDAVGGLVLFSPRRQIWDLLYVV